MPRKNAYHEIRVSPEGITLDAVGHNSGEVLDSKSQRKRNSLRWTRLVTALSKLTVTQLQALGFSEQLQDAIRVAARESSYNARNRQIKYIAGLLRDEGGELDATVEKVRLQLRGFGIRLQI